MGITVHTEIPKDEWIDLADAVGADNGRTSNSGNAILVYVKAETKPDANSKSGHRLVDDDLFDYVVASPETIWMRALHANGIASVTPDLAVAVTDGSKNVAIHDGNGNPLSSYYDTDTDTYVLNTHGADVHNQVVNKYMHQHTATETTIAVATVGDGTEYEIVVADTAGFVVGDPIHLNTGSVETTHPFITAVAAGTPGTFTLDRRLDRSHDVGDVVTKVVVNMALQDGTMAAPQFYWMGPEGDEVFHVTRLLFEATHDASGDLGKFMGISALTNGAVLRARVNGQYGTFTNWKRNGDIKTDMFNVEFDPRSGGQGDFGTSGRGTFTEAGAVVRLNGATDDRIEIYVQDPMLGLGLNSWTMKMQGHLEGG